MPLPGPKKSATLQLRTETRVSGAGVSWTYSTVGTFDAVFAPLKAEERIYFDKDTVFATHRLMADHVTVKGASATSELTESNRIVIGGTNYEITGVQDFDGGFIGRHYEVALRLVT